MQLNTTERAQDNGFVPNNAVRCTDKHVVLRAVGGSNGVTEQNDLMSIWQRFTLQNPPPVIPPINIVGYQLYSSCRNAPA